jgi:hypothetical protein
MKCSPSDDVFRGARSYSEVQFRIRSLAPEDRASVLKFQEHRRRCLPVVLGGLGLSKDKEKEAESSAGKTSNPEKRQEGEQEQNPEQDKSPERGKSPEKEKSPEQEKNPEKEKSPEREENPETEKETTDPSGGGNKRSIIRKQGRRLLTPRKGEIHSAHQGRVRSRSGNPSPLSHPCSRHREALARDGYLVKN